MKSDYSAKAREVLKEQIMEQFLLTRFDSDDANLLCTEKSDICALSLMAAALHTLTLACEFSHEGTDSAIIAAIKPLEEFFRNEC
jgi:hypothetical protein